MLVDMMISTYYWIDRPENLPSMDFEWTKNSMKVIGKWKNTVERFPQPLQQEGNVTAVS